MAHDIEPLPGPVSDCPAGSPDNCPFERRKDDPWRHEFSERINAMEQLLAENTRITSAIKTNTDEIVALYANAKGFLRFGGLLGSFATWLGKVAIMAGILWVIFKYGVGEALQDIFGGRRK